VILFYDTAYVDSQGVVHFADDYYGHDAKLEAALAHGFPYRARADASRRDRAVRRGPGRAAGLARDVARHCPDVLSPPGRVASAPRLSLHRLPHEDAAVGHEAEIETAVLQQIGAK